MGIAAAPTDAWPPPSPQEQNGDSHQLGEWRGPGRDMLPLPMRSRKYQEGLETAERPREGGHSPLDSADVRVQVPRTVGDVSSGALPSGRPGPSPGSEATALCCLGAWRTWHLWTVQDT